MFRRFSPVNLSTPHFLFLKWLSSIKRSISLSTTSSSPSCSTLQLIECPRDAIQGLHDFVPTADKINYINAILKVGFDTVDCASFVSATAVPQMRDSTEVLAGLDREYIFVENDNGKNISNENNSDVPSEDGKKYIIKKNKSKLLVICCNIQGVEKACAQPNVYYIGYSLSASETFQQRNSHCSIKKSIEKLKIVSQLCADAGKELLTYVSMAFGNPYGEAYSIESLNRVIQQILHTIDRRGPPSSSSASLFPIVSLADTVGVSSPDLIKKIFTIIPTQYHQVLWGAHFHTGATTALEKINAALESGGCHRIDCAIGGMGGCPFAKSSLIGNVPTEAVMEALWERGLLVNNHHHDHQENNKDKKDISGTNQTSPSSLSFSTSLFNPVQLDLDQLNRCRALKHEIFGVAVKEILLARILDDEEQFNELTSRHFCMYHNDSAVSSGQKGTKGLVKAEFQKAMTEVFSELKEDPPSPEKIDRVFHEYCSLYGKIKKEEEGSKAKVDDIVTEKAYVLAARRMLSKRLEQKRVV